MDIGEWWMICQIYSFPLWMKKKQKKKNDDEMLVKDPAN